ncbi:MAG: hypothetical protein CME61_04510 [Halobacteriovoraceae bacterium]|nr:hypothetical protein [Halobacteriovoraceae bacterium]
MEKLTSSFYLDYNATSPLSESVKDYLERGDFVFANPSSAYQLGKQSRKVINNSREFLFRNFGIDEARFQLVFHSGATEGMNTLLFGSAFYSFKHKTKTSFYISPTDHSCVVNLKADLESMGHNVFFIPINKNGEIKKSELINLVKSDKADRIIVNWTWLNNETGVVNTLKDAVEIKNETNCEIICDSVQTPGKIPGWESLTNDLDAYVYSSHKFGGLKGVGFSFIKDSFKYSSLITGGGQQKGSRSGTENPMGVYTTELALRDLVNSFTSSYINQLINIKSKIEKTIIECLGEDVIVARDALEKNINTISFIIPDTNANLLLMAFDLSGFQVSSGSACSSGSNIPSRILEALGLSEELTKSGIRISLGKQTALLSDNEVSELLSLLKNILRKYKK